MSGIFMKSTVRLVYIYIFEIVSVYRVLKKYHMSGMIVLCTYVMKSTVRPVNIYVLCILVKK